MANRATSPLAGKRIVVTRAREQSEELCREIERRGAVACLLPLMRFASPKNPGPLDAALRHLSQFDWLFLTSQNVVRALVARCRALELPAPPSPGAMQIAAVGAATADTAGRAGWRVSYISKTPQGLALAKELGPKLSSRHVLLPRSDLASPELPAALRELGARVTEVVAYRTVRPTAAEEERLDEVLRGAVDAILFFSPSAVHHFAESAGSERLRGLQVRATFAAIGPVTAAALREAGISSMVVSQEASVSGILDALSSHWAREAHEGAKSA